MFFKYSGLTVDVRRCSGGFEFLSPFTGEWIEVRGEISHCKNRIHQHLHLENDVPIGDVEEVKPDEQ